MPNIRKTTITTTKTPPHTVKSYLVCVAKSVRARQTAAVIPTANKTYIRNNKYQNNYIRTSFNIYIIVILKTNLIWSITTCSHTQQKRLSQSKKSKEYKIHGCFASYSFATGHGYHGDEKDGHCNPEDCWIHHGKSFRGLMESEKGHKAKCN